MGHAPTVSSRGSPRIAFGVTRVCNRNHRDVRLKKDWRGTGDNDLRLITEATRQAVLEAIIEEGRIFNRES